MRVASEAVVSESGGQTEQAEQTEQTDRNEQTVPSDRIEQVENVVLGGGEAGKYVAWTLAQQGRPVLVIERGLVGGSCPNISCLPRWRTSPGTRATTALPPDG